MEQIKFLGGIKGYGVFIHKDTILVYKDMKLITQQQAQGLQKCIDNAKDLKLEWTSFPDFEGIYIYDKSDENFKFVVFL